LALGPLHRHALRGERGLRLDMGRASALEAGFCARDLAGDARLIGAALVEGGVARFHLGADLLELRADLLAALAVALLRLQRLQLLDLRVVVGLPARVDLLASGLQRS